MEMKLDWKKYAKLAREMVAESCVLLKNDNGTLPLGEGDRVSLFGRIQFNYYKSGTGSGGLVNAPYVVSILDALRNNEQITVNERLVETYEQWLLENPFDIGEGWAKEPWSQKEMVLTEEVVTRAKEESDIAIIIIGRTAGEDQDNSVSKGSYLLTDEEEHMIRLVCESFERVVVLLNVGNIIDMKWVDRYNPQAVMYIWQGGCEGGNGVADVLTGKVSPSGKLSDTIAVDIYDYPAAKNFGDAKLNQYVEDIYVGYRYFETFQKGKVKYPFGRGMSYTVFQQKVLEMKEESSNISIQVEIRNIGTVAGKEVIQVYYASPQGRLGKPLRSLIGFKKTKLLQPNESQVLTFEVSLEEMASYDDGGYTGHKACYVLEAGKYELFAGNSVRDVVSIGSILVEELRVTKVLSEACAPVQPFKRIKPLQIGEGYFKDEEEEVPLRTVDLKKRIREQQPLADTYTGDKGYKLIDVYEEKVSIDAFLAQLSDEDCIHMSRGEGMCSPKVTAGTAGAFGGVTDSLIHFGIPTICCSDGPSGIRMDNGSEAFSLPNGTATACSFNTALCEELYEMLGLELRKNQIDTLLGPGMNIHRHPLNGRNFEYFSEDPYLTGKMAAAELKGMHKYHATGTMKHFACNNQEFKRTEVDAIVSERALREIYLKGYEIAVKEAHAYSVMTTYNPLNGIWTAGNDDLVTTILRNEWGFEGIVMTDWWAKMNDEGEEGTRHNTTAMIRAQNDLYMVTADAKNNSNEDNTLQGLQEGKIGRGDLVRNAKNICTFILKSPALQRVTGRETDAVEEVNYISTTGTMVKEIKEINLLEERVMIDASNLSTKRGSSMMFHLTTPMDGVCVIDFKLSADIIGVAQIPMTVSLDEELLETIIVNQTNCSGVRKQVKFTLNQLNNNMLKLFFGESGMRIEEMSIAVIN